MCLIPCVTNAASRVKVPHRGDRGNDQLHAPAGTGSNDVEYWVLHQAATHPCYTRPSRQPAKALRIKGLKGLAEREGPELVPIRKS